ncbi:MAG TPA: hypothetical protein VF584_08175 [Longimicrobium sp.]|jgi:hypothetical protein
MFQDEKWKIRRYIHHDKPTSISEAALAAALRRARANNQSNSLSFSLITDITSCIHAGDILKIDFTHSPPEISTVELKEGRVNDAIGNLLSRNPKPNEEELAALEAEFGKKVRRQVRRTLDQQARLSATEGAVAREYGVDVRTGVKFIASREHFRVSSWDEEYSQLIDAAVQSGFAARVIDDSLTVVAYMAGAADDEAEFMSHVSPYIDDGILNSVHGIARESTYVDLRNALEQMTDFRESLRAGEYLTPWVIPVGIDRIHDVVHGRLIVKLHIDGTKLIELSRKLEQPLRWATKQELAPYAETPAAARPARFGRGSLAADRIGSKIFVGDGLLTRVLFDFTRPSSLIGLVYHETDRADRLHADIVAR